MNQDSFAVDRFGTITKWPSTQGIDIIYPRQQTPEGKVRGTCFIVAPVFGKPPKTGAWAGASLPQHGFVRLLDANYPVVSGFEASTSTHYLDLNIRPSEGYHWGFSLGAQIVHSSPHLVDYWLIVGRMQGCENRGRMPLSFGLHPYFATHGESWEIFLGDELVADSSRSYAKAESFDCVRNQQVFLRTVHGIVKLKLGEFDQVVIWSDNPLEYVCIEPTLGLRQELLLTPSVMKHGRCRMEFIETPRTYTRH